MITKQGNREYISEENYDQVKYEAQWPFHPQQIYSQIMLLGSKSRHE